MSAPTILNDLTIHDVHADWAWVHPDDKRISVPGRDGSTMVISDPTILGTTGDGYDLTYLDPTGRITGEEHLETDEELAVFVIEHVGVGR